MAAASSHAQGYLCQNQANRFVDKAREHLAQERRNMEAMLRDVAEGDDDVARAHRASRSTRASSQDANADGHISTACVVCGSPQEEAQGVSRADDGHVQSVDGFTTKRINILKRKA